MKGMDIGCTGAIISMLQQPGTLYHDNGAPKARPMREQSAYHDAMLLRGVRHLHAPGTTNGRVRHIPIASNLIGGVDDDDSLAQIVC